MVRQALYTYFLVFYTLTLHFVRALPAGLDVKTGLKSGLYT